MAGNSGGKAPRFKPPNLNERTLPPWMDAENKHGQVVVVSIKPQNENGKLPDNPFVVAKTVQTAIGKVTDAYRVKNKEEVIVKVRSTSDADKLMAIKELFDGTKVSITSPETLNSTKGVVSCERTAQLSDQELKDELKDQGVIEVKRFTRNGPKGRMNTDTMLLTFSGLSLPAEVFFGFEKCRVREFRPNPMLCFNCVEYGHVTKFCKKKEACKTCSESHQTKDDEGNSIKCAKKPFCKNCQGNHPPTDRKCPKYVEEATVIDIKHDQKVSYSEARRILRERSAANETSYASVSGTTTSVQGRLAAAAADDSATVVALRAEVAKMKSTIDTLKKTTAKENELKKELNAALRVIKDLQAEVRDLRAAAPPRDTPMDAEEESRKRHRDSSSSADSTQSTVKRANENCTSSGDEFEDPVANIDEDNTKPIHIDHNGEVFINNIKPESDKPSLNQQTPKLNKNEAIKKFLKDDKTQQRNRSKEPKPKDKNKHKRQ